jgi:Flp pilus assembly protein TadD
MLAAGDAKGAVRVLENALRFTPNDEDLHYNLGVAYARIGDITNAELQTVLRLNPGNEPAQSALNKLFPTPPKSAP